MITQICNPHILFCVSSGDDHYASVAAMECSFGDIDYHVCIRSEN